MSVDWYILDKNQNPVRATEREAMKFYKDIRMRRINYTIVGDFKVSTIFLSLDHGVGNGPLLFETAILDKDGRLSDEGYNYYPERYATVQEAREGHDRAIEWIWDTFYAKESADE